MAGTRVRATMTDRLPRPTIRDVAEVAGVSLGTVSNLINNVKPVAPETRAKIEEAIEQLQFVPNRALRTMRGGRAPAIGYVVSDSPDPFFVEVARGVEDVARQSGLVVVSCNTTGSREYERQYVTALAEMRVTGAIVMPSFEHSDLPFRSLRASGAALVVLGEWDNDTCSIAVDDEEGGRLAVHHLLELGHRDICFLGGPGGEHQIEYRHRGAKAAYRELGLSPDRLSRLDAGGVTAAARAALVDDLLDLNPRPTAVFCASDTLALIAMNGLLRRGVTLPDDMSIVGFNDIAAAELAVVPLTTVAVPKYELGLNAAGMLLDESKPTHRHEHLVLSPSLVIRDSTGRRPG